jgi:hypothetical protein
MFAKKYPNISTLINSLNDDSKIKLNNNIDSIKCQQNIDSINMQSTIIDTIVNNVSNVLFITDYEITCKISHYYLNLDIPISRNSNTITIKNMYSSYIYYLTRYILMGTKYPERYSYGEFVINIDDMYDIIIELETLIDQVLKNNNYNDPLPKIKLIFSDLINNSFDNIKYLYLSIDDLVSEISSSQSSISSRSSLQSSISSRSVSVSLISSRSLISLPSIISSYSKLELIKDTFDDRSSNISNFENDINNNLDNILDNKN